MHGSKLDFSQYCFAFLRLLFILILLLNIAHNVHVHIAVRPCKRMVVVDASHADSGGVGIPQSKQANATRVSRHLRGRAKGENLLVFSHVFFIIVCTRGGKLPISPIHL